MVSIYPSLTLSTGFYLDSIRDRFTGQIAGFAQIQTKSRRLQKKVRFAVYTTLAVMALGVSSVAIASDCQSKIDELNTALVNTSSLDPVTITHYERRRDEAALICEAGNVELAMTILDEMLLLISEGV